MNKEKILVYPYDEQFTPVLRHKCLLEEYEIVKLVSPKGWGLCSKDAGYADGGDNIHLEVTSDFEESLTICDTVLFCESINHLDFEKYIMPKITIAIENKKNIALCIPITDDVYKTILKKCNANNVSLKHYNYIEKPDIPIELNSENELLFEINTPVVFVLGISERSNKFEIQLSLRENILKMGYKVGQIGTRNYCEMLGFHSFPNFMFANRISESQKIILFNHYIKKIEVSEHPDIIIIGVPGGIMPYNNKLLNNFGITAFEISQSVTPDFTVFSYQYEQYSPEYFTKTTNSVKYKFGYEIDCFNTANVKFDWATSKFDNQLTYISLESKFVSEKIKNYKTTCKPIFNILDKNDSKDLSNLIIDRLSQYGNTECI